MSYKGKFCFLTDIGQVRSINEDFAIALTNVTGDVFMIVCDGMGGHKKGDVAAKMTVDYLANAFRLKQKFTSVLMSKIWLQKEIKKINKKIYALANSEESYANMGTTIVAVIIKDNQFIVANMGDSRAYIIKDNQLVQLTEDQTYVEHLYRIGKITKEEVVSHPKRHILTNALGIFPTVNLELSVHKYNKERIFLCSDGLYNNVSTEELFAILTRDEQLQTKCSAAIKACNDNGGSDNAAIAIWEVEQ